MARLLRMLILALVAVSVLPATANAAITPTPLGGAVWRVKTIRVFDATRSPFYHEGVTLALRAWNESRVGVTLAWTTNRSIANVIVVAKPLPGTVAGTGTLGAASPGVVTLDTSLLTSDPVIVGNTIFPAFGGYPEAVAEVAAHEFGHVLGLNHTTGCSLMRTTGLGGCGLTPPAGSWTCRLPQRKDVLALRRRYHGAGVLRANPYCRFSATPAGKVGVVTVGASNSSRAVKLDWKSTWNSHGYVVARGSAGGGCPASPDAGEAHVDAGGSELTQTWFDIPRTAARYCFAIWAKNGRGALTGPTRVFADITPPAVPVVAPISNLTASVSGANVVFTWTNPSGTTKVVRLYRVAADHGCSVPSGFLPTAKGGEGATSATDFDVPSGTWMWVATRSNDPDDDVDSDGTPPVVSSPVCTSPVTIP